jgi:glycosyltransferase involved in cell wall biosynthesis
MDRSRLRIVLVHDWLTVYGGAEEMFREVVGLFPDAPIVAAQYNPATMKFLEGREVRTSWISGLPLSKTKHYLYSPILADVYRGFDLGEFDVVLSDSHSFAHGARKREGGLHVCYYHTPARSLWVPEVDQRASGWLKQRIAKRIKRLDLEAAKGPDVALANSRTTAERVERIYRRPVAEVIYPPVDTGKWLSARGGGGTGLLMWGRLIPYKRVDLAIEAVRITGDQLHVVGGGPIRERLEAQAAGMANVRFHGRLSDDALRALIGECRALLFPGYEDFGIVPVEAMAAGLPVVAFGKGGASETVLPEFGALFHQQTPQALAEGIRSLGGRTFDVDAMKDHASKFDVLVFRERYRAAVERAIAAHFG